MKWLCLALVVMAFVPNALHASSIRKVTIGHAANFSEVNSSAINPYKLDSSNGMQLALKKFESRLTAKGFAVEVKEFDYGSSNTSAVGLSETIATSNAVAVIGFYESSQALLALKKLTSAKIPYVSPLSSANRLFTKNNNIFHMGFSNRQMGTSMARFAKEKLSSKSALLIEAIDCAYCSDLSKSFRVEAQRLGMDLESASVLLEDTNFEAIVGRVASNRYDLIVVPNYELASARLISHLMSKGVRAKFLGGDGWADADREGFLKIVTNPEFEGYCVSHWDQRYSSKVGLDFDRDWKSRHKSEPSVYAAFAYDSMSRLLEATLKTKHATRQEIASAINLKGEFDGVTGRFEVNEVGEILKPISFLKANTKLKKFEPFFELALAHSSDGRKQKL